MPYARRAYWGGRRERGILYAKPRMTSTRHDHGADNQDDACAGNAPGKCTHAFGRSGLRAPLASWGRLRPPRRAALGAPETANRLRLIASGREHFTLPHQTASQSLPGIIRFMNSSKSGTVNAVSPWLGLQIMPLAMRLLRIGPKAVTRLLSLSAISPDLCGPGPSSAMARRYFFSVGVNRSKRTRKKLSSRAAIASFEAVATS